MTKVPAFEGPHEIAIFPPQPEDAGILDTLNSVDPNNSTSIEEVQALVGELPDRLSCVSRLLGSVTLVNSAGASRRYGLDRHNFQLRIGTDTVPQPLGKIHHAQSQEGQGGRLWLASQLPTGPKAGPEEADSIDPPWAEYVLPALPFIRHSEVARLIHTTRQRLTPELRSEEDSTLKPITFVERGEKELGWLPVWLPAQFNELVRKLERQRQAKQILSRLGHH